MDWKEEQDFWRKLKWTQCDCWSNTEWREEQDFWPKMGQAQCDCWSKTTEWREKLGLQLTQTELLTNLHV